MSEIKRTFEKINSSLDEKFYQGRVHDCLNIIVFFAWFMFYALTFMVPKFYGLTEKISGLIVFAFLGVLFLLNVNPIKAIKQMDADFIITAAIVVITGVNLIVVNSGLGAFFTAANFAIIFYMCRKIHFKLWQFYTVGCMYLLLMLYWFFHTYGWMFKEYGTYAMNTNTAATFTIFSLLCLFVLAELLYKKHEIFGLLMVIIFVKGVQLALYHRARGAFIMLFVFLFFRFIVPKKFWSNKVFLNAVTCFATFGSLVFVSFYIILGTTGVNFRIPFFYKNMFSGREKIWLEFWNLFTKKPLTGIGTNLTITSFFEFNVHNAMYDILVIHGLLVFLLTMVLIFRRVNSIKVTGKNHVVICGLSAVLAVFIESFFDVDLIWSNYALNLLFLLIAMNAGEIYGEA